MGGFGSGRTASTEKIEDHRSLDVNRLRTAGCLQPGYRGCWRWTRTAHIDLRAGADRLILRYRTRRDAGPWEDVEEAVPLTWSACRYGGTRAYFLCPGITNGRHCGRRVTKIYAAGRYFLCRHCYKLGHASRSEARHDRLLRRARKCREALGGDPSTHSPVPPKPKGMHWRTYDRLVDEILAAEVEADSAFLAR